MGNLCAEVFKGNSRTLNVMRGMTPRKFSKSEKNRNQPLLTRQAAQQPSSPSTLHLACLGRVFGRGSPWARRRLLLARCAPLRRTPPRPSSGIVCRVFPSASPSASLRVALGRARNGGPIYYRVVVGGVLCVCACKLGAVCACQCSEVQ